MDISNILPNLFVGPCPQSPRDIDQLKRDYKILAAVQKLLRDLGSTGANGVIPGRTSGMVMDI